MSALVLVLVAVATILAAIELIRSHAENLLAWSCLLIDVALLVYLLSR